MWRPRDGAWIGPADGNNSSGRVVENGGRPAALLLLLLLLLFFSFFRWILPFYWAVETAFRMGGEVASICRRPGALTRWNPPLELATGTRQWS